MNPNKIQKIYLFFWCIYVGLLLASYISNMGSLRRGVNISVLRHEAEFYGITPLGMLLNKVTHTRKQSQPSTSANTVKSLQ